MLGAAHQHERRLGLLFSRDAGRGSGASAKMIEIDPDFSGAYWLQGAIHLSEGDFGRAVEQLKLAVSLAAHQIVVADLASAYRLAGQDDEAAAILGQLLEMRRQHYVPAICMAA